MILFFNIDLKGKGWGIETQPFWNGSLFRNDRNQKLWHFDNSATRKHHCLGNPSWEADTNSWITPTRNQTWFLQTRAKHTLTEPWRNPKQVFLGETNFCRGYPNTLYMHFFCYSPEHARICRQASVLACAHTDVWEKWYRRTNTHTDRYTDR